MNDHSEYLTQTHTRFEKNMEYVELKNLVADEVKGRCTPEQRRYLEKSIDSWIETLELLEKMTAQQLVDLESQLEEFRVRGSECGTVSAELVLLEVNLMDRIRKTGSFRGHVQRRLAEVRAIKSEQAAHEGIDEVRLREAIRLHKDLIDQGYDADAVDAALYDVLDGQWKFDELLACSTTSGV